MPSKFNKFTGTSNWNELSDEDKQWHRESVADFFCDYLLEKLNEDPAFLDKFRENNDKKPRVRRG